MHWTTGIRFAPLRGCTSIATAALVLLTSVAALTQDVSIAPDWVAISANAGVAATGSRALGSTDQHNGVIVSVYELDRGALIHQIPLSGVDLVSLILSPDGYYLAAVSRKFPSVDESTQVFEVRTGTPLLSFELYNQGGGKWLAFAGSGAHQTIIAAKWDSSIDEFSLASRKKVRSFEGFHDSVHAVAVSTDSRYVLAGGQDNTARLFDHASGNMIGQTLKHDGPVLAVAFARDSSIFATGSADGHARIWKAPSGQSVNDFATGWPVLGVALSPDGSSVGIGGLGSFQCSPVSSGESGWSKNVTENSDPVRIVGVRFSFDGQKVLALPDPGHARVYTANDGRIVRPTASQAYWGADFARDKPSMIYSRETGTFTIDLISAKPVFRLDPKGSVRNGSQN